MTSINHRLWSLVKKIGFRFSFSYFLLFVLYDLVTRVGSMIQLPIKPHHDFILWVGQTIFKISEERLVVMDNFVDTTFNYMALLCIFIIAIIVALFWTFLDGKRQNYKSLYYWLRVVLRFYLGFIMVNYGLVKLVHLQFPEPSLYTLVNTYGNSSPMGLAWSFLGYSKGYNVFMGLAEVMSLCLFFRRTLTFGLFITLTVTLNVMAINFFYGVPLKMVTSHLVLITLFLMAPNFRSLVDFFFRKKNASLIVLEKPEFLNKKSRRKLVMAMRGLFIVLMFALAAYKLNNRNTLLNGEFTKSKFYGIYDVLSFESIGTKDSTNHRPKKSWKYLIMEYRGQIQLVDSENKVSWFSSSIDSLEHSIQIFNVDNSTESLLLRYERLTNDTIIFKGHINKDSTKITCRQLRKEDFLLMNSKFNLINDQPYIR
ncbi:MAG: hypothetical protein AAFX55_09280 [Bacteroidota bacterium]